MLDAEAGDERLLASDRALFTARVDSRTAARVGGRLELALDSARFQFFSAETGARIRTGAPRPAMVTG